MSEIMPEAVVCIPSFRRPEGLQKTLNSLAAQKVDFPSPSSSSIMTGWARRGWPSRALFCRERNDGPDAG